MGYRPIVNGIGWLLGCGLVLLAGCASPTAPNIALPLAQDKPTFLFFFTDP